MRSIIFGGRAMLIALVVLAVTPAVFAQSATGVEHASPAARGIGESSVPSESLADTTGGGGSTEHCGPIDPSTPCYSTGGSTTCPANTSAEKCKERCECQYKKNVERCKNGQACLLLARTEKSACDTNCTTDWT